MKAKNLYRCLLALALAGPFVVSAAVEPFIKTNSISANAEGGKQQLPTDDERDVKDFNGVAAGGPIQVRISIGSTEGIRFEGDADAIATLITEVKGHVLIIRPQSSWSSWSRKYRGKKITAYVSAKTIQSLTMSGSGSMRVDGKISGRSLATTLSGSGSITSEAAVDEFTGVISGSGNLNISGSAQKADIVLSGSGAFTRKGFTVDRLSSTVSGSGSVNITANDHLEAVISGSGSVNYSGNAHVEKRIVGSGSVRKI